MLAGKVPDGRLVNALLSLPATLIWGPICGHYLFVFGFMTGLGVVGGLASTAGGKPLWIALGVSVWCAAGLIGLAALWVLIVWGDEVSVAGGPALYLLRGGLWIGFAACVLALALAAGVFWRSGFNFVMHGLFLTVLGPMAVHLRELGRREHSEPTLDRC